MNAQATTVEKVPSIVDGLNLTDSQTERYFQLTDDEGLSETDALAKLRLEVEAAKVQTAGPASTINPNAGGTNQEARAAALIAAGSDDISVLFGHDGMVADDELESTQRKTYKLSELGAIDGADGDKFKAWKPVGLLEVLSWQRRQDPNQPTGPTNVTVYKSSQVKRANPFVFWGKEEFGWQTAVIEPCDLIDADGNRRKGHTLLGTVQDLRSQGGELIQMRMPISADCTEFFAAFSQEVNNLKGTGAEMNRGRVLKIAKDMHMRKQGGVNKTVGLSGRGAIAAHRRMQAAASASNSTQQEPGHDSVTGLPAGGSTGSSNGQ